MTTNTNTQVMQQALDALEHVDEDGLLGKHRPVIRKAIAALREAIAAHDAEIAALKAAQPAPAAPYQVTDEDVRKAVEKIYFRHDKVMTDTEIMRELLEAYEARKAAA